jgi:CRISPR-associated protein Csx17
MSLINWPEKYPLPRSTREHQPLPPTLYAMLKLCFPPVQNDHPVGILAVPPAPAIHRLAAIGRGTDAATQALRRLRASGYRPHLSALPISGPTAIRTAAALLFPISPQTLQTLPIQMMRSVKNEVLIS